VERVCVQAASLGFGPLSWKQRTAAAARPGSSEPGRVELQTKRAVPAAARTVGGWLLGTAWRSEKQLSLLEK